MSESENKVEHDRNGYLNCQQCSRRYLTLVGFVNHVKLEHGDVNPKQIETKQDSNCVSNDVVHSKIQPKFKEDQESFLKNNIHIVHEKLKPHQCQECKRKCSSKSQNYKQSCDNFQPQQLPRDL